MHVAGRDAVAGVNVPSDSATDHTRARVYIPDGYEEDCAAQHGLTLGISRTMKIAGNHDELKPDC
jgi:hypothetical protein